MSVRKVIFAPVKGEIRDPTEKRDEYEWCVEMVIKENEHVDENELSLHDMISHRPLYTEEKIIDVIAVNEYFVALSKDTNVVRRSKNKLIIFNNRDFFYSQTLEHHWDKLLAIPNTDKLEFYLLKNNWFALAKWKNNVIEITARHKDYDVFRPINADKVVVAKDSSLHCYMPSHESWFSWDWSSDSRITDIKFVAENPLTFLVSTANSIVKITNVDRAFEKTVVIDKHPVFEFIVEDQDIYTTNGDFIDCYRDGKRVMHVLASGKNLMFYRYTVDIKDKQVSTNMLIMHDETGIKMIVNEKLYRLVDRDNIDKFVVNGDDIVMYLKAGDLNLFSPDLPNLIYTTKLFEELHSHDNSDTAISIADKTIISESKLNINEVVDDYINKKYGDKIRNCLRATIYDIIDEELKTIK